MEEAVAQQERPSLKGQPAEGHPRLRLPRLQGQEADHVELASRPQHLPQRREHDRFVYPLLPPLPTLRFTRPSDRTPFMGVGAVPSRTVIRCTWWSAPSGKSVNPLIAEGNTGLLAMLPVQFCVALYSHSPELEPQIKAHWKRLDVRVFLNIAVGSGLLAEIRSAPELKACHAIGRALIFHCAFDVLAPQCGGGVEEMQGVEHPACVHGGTSSTVAAHVHNA